MDIDDEFEEIESPAKKFAKLDQHGFVIPANELATYKAPPPETPKQAGKRISREQKWVTVIQNYQDLSINYPERIVNLCSKGIPQKYRSLVWRKMLNINYYKSQYPENYFNELCSKPSNEHTEQIELDIPRTYPNHKRFFTKKGKNDLLNVLQSYSYHNAKVGYCQGMSYIVGVFLIYCSPEETFWLLVSLLERETMGYYMSGMPQLISDSILFQKLLDIENQQLSNHLKSNGMDPLLYVTPWWMCFFTTFVDWGAIMRFWDLIIFEGVNALFRISLIILRNSSEILLKKKGADGLLPYLLRPPLDDIGGVNSILKSSIELPINQMIQRAKELQKIELEQQLLLKQQKEQQLLQQQQLQQKAPTLSRSSSNVTNNSEPSVFDKFIKVFTNEDEIEATVEKDSIGKTKDQHHSNNTHQQPQPVILKTPVKESNGLFSNKLKEISNRIKSKLIPSANKYQPCNVILEQKKSRKSVARRPSIIPKNNATSNSTNIGKKPRASISRKSISGRKSIGKPRRSIRPSITPKISMQTDPLPITTTITTTTNNINIIESYKMESEFKIKSPIKPTLINNNNIISQQSLIYSNTTSYLSSPMSPSSFKHIKPPPSISNSTSTSSSNLFNSSIGNLKSPYFMSNNFSINSNSPLKKNNNIMNNQFLSPMKTTPTKPTISKSIEFIKEVMMTPPKNSIMSSITNHQMLNNNPFDKIKWNWVQATDENDLKNQVSFNSPQQIFSPSLDEKQFLKEFSTPLKERKLTNTSTPITIKGGNQYKRVENSESKRSSTRFQTPLANHGQENRFNNETFDKTPIKFPSLTTDLNTSADNDFTMEIDSPDHSQILEMVNVSHQQYLTKKQTKKWDLRV
ncbi:RabGAP/TBC domain-containing protein [Tieghemostelium lacteum]|uniref:RabGAP/TBC domain-containing protein n=1 Tax=Tieghemostelium lacteum TaxID=361077 RepID=A0A151ZA67_TIELA|nr:RabGAP/TBC domain-containing protein [Tieghemostelium lacteum]|eukprot:KYQ90841.1 RabGAP/TBC domain-containing protein [Tieghemostelium lacteum]